LAFTIPNILRSFIKRGKNDLEHVQNQNVIYKISCEDCDVSYVGQTKRQLKTRLHEHDINISSKSPSVISNHRIEENHNFNIFRCLNLSIIITAVFLGYVLPWTNIFLRSNGGFSINNSTLNRFFFFHFILPFIIILFIFIHLFFLYSTGSYDPSPIN
ncbi:CYB protein, partial [Acromyrmex heyeri]